MSQRSSTESFAKLPKLPAEERWLLLFAPSDADGDFLRLKQDLSELREKLEAAKVHLLEVFESLEVHAGEQVADPKIAGSLRERYAAPPGSLTVAILAPGKSAPVARLAGTVDGRQVMSALTKAFGLPP